MNLHFDSLIQWYPLERAAKRLEEKTGLSFTVDHLLGAISQGLLPVYLDVKERYAMPVAWCCAVLFDPAEDLSFKITGIDRTKLHLINLSLRPSGKQRWRIAHSEQCAAVEHHGVEWNSWQRGPEYLVPQSPIIDVLWEPLRLVIEDRCDYVDLAGDNQRGQKFFTDGVLLEDDDGRLLQLMQKRPESAKESLAAEDYFQLFTFPPPRDELRLSDYDLRIFETNWSNDGKYSGKQITKPSTRIRTTSSLPRMGEAGARAHRQEALIHDLESLYPNVLSIPEEDKAKLMAEICTKNRLFTESTFTKAWSDLSTSGRIRTQKKQKTHTSGPTNDHRANGIDAETQGETGAETRVSSPSGKAAPSVEQRRWDEIVPSSQPSKSEH